MNITVDKKSSFLLKFVGNYKLCEIKIKSSELFSGYLASDELQQSIVQDIQKLKDENPVVVRESYYKANVDCEKTPYMIIINGNDKSIILKITVHYFPMNGVRRYPISGFGI
jgi:hypothetical protein